MSKESENKSNFIGVISVIFMVALTAALAALVFFYVTYSIHSSDCVSDDEHFVKSGIVSKVEFLGDCNLIDFEDGSFLYLHGSPNEKYDLYEIKNLLAFGVNYTFYYHHECVMSDGNEVYYHEGNVIDKIKVK